MRGSLDAHTTPSHASPAHGCTDPWRLSRGSLGAISARDHSACKHEFEQPFAHAVEASMAIAWEMEMNHQKEDCLLVDTGWDHGRNGSNAVMPVMTTSGRILDIEVARRNDPGVNSSQVMEKISFNKLLNNPLMQLMLYTQVGMDGCAPLIAAARKARASPAAPRPCPLPTRPSPLALPPTRSCPPRPCGPLSRPYPAGSFPPYPMSRPWRCQAGLVVQGDGWHGCRNRGKHFKAHVESYCPREQPSAIEQAVRKVRILCSCREGKGCAWGW